MLIAKGAAPAPFEDGSTKGIQTAPFVPPFPEVAPRLLDADYHPLPLLPGGKAPALASWQHLCHRPPGERTIAQWSKRFPTAGTGAACGKLVAADIDTLDEEAAFEAERKARSILGDTPLLRIGRAPKRVLLYRAPVPFDSAKVGTFEVLALGRQVVLYHLHPDTGRPYVWPDENPLDVPVSALPPVTEQAARRWLDAMTGERPTRTAMVTAEKGFRQDTFFPLVRRAGRTAASFDDLLAEAQRLNSTVCVPPLPDSQVIATARGVWRYREQGTLWTDDGEARALVSASEFSTLADEPDALALLMLLRLSHGARSDAFMLLADRMAAAKLIGDFGEKRYAKLRDALIERGFLDLVHRGHGRGNASMYRLTPTAAKGSETAGIYKEYPPHALIGIERTRTLVQVRYELDGSTTVTTATETTRLLFDPAALPIQPTPAEILRQTARAAFRSAGRGAQSRAAEALGITRGQMASYLSGRYGLNPTAEAALKDIVSGGGGAR